VRDKHILITLPVMKILRIHFFRILEHSKEHPKKKIKISNLKNLSKNTPINKTIKIKNDSVGRSISDIHSFP